MTLIIEIGLGMIKMHPHTKIHVRSSNSSTMRALNYRDTHRHTHGTDSITLTADAEGKNISLNCLLF